MSVMPWPATRVAQTISCGPSGSWKARTAASRSRDRVARRAGAGRPGSARARPAAPRRWRGEHDERLVGGQEVVDPGERRRRSLPRAARRCSVLSCASRSARSVAAILASSSDRSSGWVAQPGDHVALGQPVLALVVERAPGRRPGAWPAAAAARPPSAAARSSARRRCQCRRSSRAGALEAAREARAGAELLEPAEHPQLGDQLLRRGSAPACRSAPAAARRRGTALGEPAHGLRALGARVLDSSATRRARAPAGARARAARGGRATIS